MKHLGSIFIVLMTLCLLTQNAFGQKYRIMASNKQFEAYRAVTKFDCIHDDFEVEKLTWVADYSVMFDTIKPGTIEEIYRTLWTRANRIGANSFKIDNSDIYALGDDKFIDVKLYFLPMERRNENMHLFRSDKVYLFGFLGHHVQLSGYEIEYNELELLITELSYRFYHLGTDKAVIRFGKRKGHELHLKGHEDHRMPHYIYFKQTVGEKQNKWIDEYEWQFGEFLIQILDKG